MDEEYEEKVGVSEVSEEELAEEMPDAFVEVKKAIEEDRYADAEKLLDKMEERGGEWYFQRAMLCKKRSWYLEASRNLQEAVKLDPENELYQKELKELEGMTEEEESEKPEDKKKKKKRKKNMGSSKGSWGDACGEGACECCGEVGCACLCEGICEGLGNGC